MSTVTIDLRAERINRGLSLAGASEQMGVQADALGRAERSEGTPHPRNAFKIASFYGYKVTELWPLDEAKAPAA